MGTQHQNVIEINGKKYNAVTGKMLGDVDSAPKSMDGVARRPKKAPTSPRSVPAHAKKQPQKSQTLMRSAVKKPTTTKKTEKPTTVASIRRPSLSTPKSRVKTAEHTKKSPLVSHFGSLDISRSSVVKKNEELEVKHHPTHTSSTKTHTQKSSHTAHTANSTASKMSAKDKMIEDALARADAHENPKVKPAKKRRKLSHKLGVSSRVMAISSAVLAGVLLVGFFAIQNVPNVSMRVAAARAGVDATMPKYNPSGFSLNGPINYSDGQVTITFKSNTGDDRAYNLTQRSSNWNSDALLSNYVVASNQQYQTYLDRGRTLYIYGGSNATWVDGGVWYQIEGESQMTTDQLVRIAASM